MKILIVDNYDSFTYNLVHQVEKFINEDVVVWRNDVVDLGKLQSFDAIVLSPGPGMPWEAGLLPQVVSACIDQRIKTLGVCLGMQAMVYHYGGKLFNLSKVAHGISLPVEICEDDKIYAGVPTGFLAGRYHSWGVKREALPLPLRASALGTWGEVMSCFHPELPICGVQYHPESILTPMGDLIMQNWLKS